MPYCPSCGTELAEDAKLCHECGANFEGDSAWKPLKSPPPKRTSPSSTHTKPSLSGGARFGNALVWAFVTGILMFFVALYTPDFIGHRGGNLEWLAAVVFPPLAFFAALMVALGWPSFGKFIPLLILVVYPVWYDLQMPTMRLAPQLTIEERERLESTHFDLRVAVARSPLPEAYQTSLVRDLNRPRLFTEVGKIGEVNSPDLIATPTGIYYGGKQKSFFSLHRSSQPAQKVYVYVWQKHPGRLSQVDPTLYRDRLALGVIDAIRRLKLQSDDANALTALRPLAEQGDANAQNKIGDMYRKGHGVARNDVEALRWYRLAAAQGVAQAKFNLGEMYQLGVAWSTGSDRVGVGPDYVRAYMWFNLSAASGYANAAKNRDIVAKQMTAQQVADAEKMARECQRRNFKGCD